MRSLILTFLISSVSLLHGESRTWKSADGAQSFTGEYVSHDTKRVTIRRADGRVFTLELTRLHDTDKTWLSTRKAAPTPKPEPLPDPKAVFDTLCFGDSQDDVKKKLKESKAVECSLDEMYLARVGLNGTYHTRQKIGGLNCELYFDWSSEGSLTEISLQTQGVDRASYDGLLKQTWAELTELLTVLHGKPVQSGKFPGLGELQDDLFLASHLWNLEGGGSALLGSSMQAGRCKVVVRFTLERIKPVTVP